MLASSLLGGTNSKQYLYADNYFIGNNQIYTTDILVILLSYVFFAFNL